MQDIQFLRIQLHLDLGEALLPESKAREIAARACELSSLRVLSYHRVSQFMGSLNWASGLIPQGRLYLRPLQRYFHSLGLTDRFTSVRPVGPCQPTAAMAGPVFSYLRNPYPSVSGGIYDFYGRLHSGVGPPHGGFPNFRYLDLSGPRAPYQSLGTQGGRGRPTSVGFSASGPPGHDSYGQFDGFIYQQARRDPVPHLVTSSSGAFYVIIGSEHTCSSPSKTHSRLSEPDSRPPISS